VLSQAPGDGSLRHHGTARKHKCPSNTAEEKAPESQKSWICDTSSQLTMAAAKQACSIGSGEQMEEFKAPRIEMRVQEKIIGRNTPNGHQHIGQ